MEAKRFKALDALKEGIVDGLGGLPETMTFIQEMELVEKSRSAVYGELKREMWRETVGYLEGFQEEERREARQEKLQTRHREDSEERVAKWERSKL